MKWGKEMNEQQFWLTLWTMVVTGVIIVVAISLFYADRTNNRLEKLINEGYDPIAIRCMIHGESESFICTRYIESKNETERVKEYAKLVNRSK